MAEQAFVQQAYPALQTCTGCHAGEMAGVGFLAGSDALAARLSLLAFTPEVVNLQAPQSSQLLTRGVHNGPALPTASVTPILNWMQLEQAAINGSGGTTLLETVHFTPMLCSVGSGTIGSGSGSGDPLAGCPVNTVALDSVGVPGGTVTFVAQGLTDGIYLNELQLVAGSAGAYIDHPLFVSYPAGSAQEIPDQLDRYYATTLNLMPSQTSMIEGGTAAFIGFEPTDPMAIDFGSAGPYQAGSGSGSGSGSASGCQQIGSFVTNAQGPLSTNCASCHGGANQAAQSAMDLSNINGSGSDLLAACDQVYSRINFQDIADSGFFLAPNPQSALTHPFKFNNNQTQFQTFYNAVVIWVTAEQTAP
jgi:hypothetical protein